MKICYLTFLVIPILASEILDCTYSSSNRVEQVCDTSNHKEYISCVTRRQKREACCDGGGDDEDCSGCGGCDCDDCSQGGCDDSCNCCCASQRQSCQTNYCCYRTCHSQCKSSQRRRSCRRSCEQTVGRLSSSSSVTSGHHGSYNGTSEIRTVLNVFNEINNTNEIKIPIDVNTTSYNNITVLTSQTGNMAYQPGYPGYDVQPYPPYPPAPPEPQPMPPHPMPFPPPPQLIPIPLPPPPQPIPIPLPPPPRMETPCCTVATPQRCVPQPTIPYVRCYYQTQQVCSEVCEAHRVVYPHTQRVCGEGMGAPCRPETLYSPQPGPTCAFGSRWPYFGCGTPQLGCSGCFDSSADASQCPDYCNGGGGYYG